MDISTEFGMINGYIKEYVFSDNCKNDGNTLSRLDWEIVTLPYTELNISVDLFKYFYVGFTGVFGFPTGSGYMQDYDWMNSLPDSPADWQAADPTELTNYSKHSNKVEKYYNFSAKLGGNIPIVNKFVITPYIGYRYDFIQMAASDGYKIYKSDNFVKEETTGKCITYAHEINEFIIGVKFDNNFFPKFPMSLYFQVVPGLGKFVALDIHHARSTAFLDVYSPVFLLDSKLSCFYEFDVHNRLGLSAFVEYVPMVKGLTGTAPYIEGEKPGNFSGSSNALGGTKRFLYGLSLSYQLSF